MIVMQKQYAEKRYGELMERLQRIESEDGSAAEKLALCLEAIRGKLELLRMQLMRQPFGSVAEEIHFFKYQKPRFYGLLIYYTERYTVERGLPAAGREAKKKYYLREIAYVERFFLQYRLQYEYFRLDASDFDVLYFTRGAESSRLIPEMPELHPDFSTNCDYLFSWFVAKERLKAWLVECLEGLEPTSEEALAEGTELRWTGDKVNLAELIYGIYFTGQINHGKTELSTLVKWMGRLFQIDLKRIYSDYKDIRSRKVASPTRFLDRMREAMLQKIDEENAFRPNASKP